MLVVAFFVFALIITACGNKKNTMLEAADYYTFGDTVMLSKGQEVKYYKKQGWDVAVRFDSLITDSRCPKGANCIWEGNAEVAITATTSKKVTPFQLNTNTTMQTTVDFETYKITLIDVTPYPTDPSKKTKPTEPQNTLIYLSVTQ